MHSVAPRPMAQTMVECLRERALREPGRTAVTMVLNGEADELSLTYSELDRRGRAVGAWLQAAAPPRDRVLVAYPPGLNYITAFLGCLYAGMIAVPAYPPRHHRNARLQAMLSDSGATVILGDERTLEAFRKHMGQDLQSVRLCSIEHLPAGLENGWQEPGISADTVAYLQYTSGSTGTPKGVMITHRNLVHNCSVMQQVLRLSPASVGGSWLPPHHDMGLVGGILLPMYAGYPALLMSPMQFVQSPYQWLQAISRHRVTLSPMPNFAFDLCTRSVTPEQRQTLDLSSLRHAVCGGEPIRRDTIERFVTAFGPCGFHLERFVPAYGMAEATLMISSNGGGAPLMLQVSKPHLEANLVVPAAGTGPDTTALIGCGRSVPGQKIVVVQPETGLLCPSEQVGEVWVSGPSVAAGYWNRPEDTEKTFRARVADTGEGPFLRTGDLGFLTYDGELVITGRLTDLIIIRGRNLYPQDIESAVQRSHEALIPGAGVALGVEAGGEERLVIVQEVHPAQKDLTAVFHSIRRAVAEEFDVHVHAIALIRQSTMPKTTSGKLQRRECKRLYLQGGLELLDSWEAAGDAP